jgi:beta-lactamase superfamily II metal-dependent hydrolase
MNSQITALFVSAACLFACDAFGQANGKLQIHFMNVGQGDGALLISPNGETVLFDNGREGKCNRPLSYLDQLGVTNIDYHITSHYHSDHFGCTAEVLSRFPLRKAAYDRGESYSSPQYTKYIGTIGNLRRTAIPGTKLDLDAGSGNPVRIEFIASNANAISSNDENDKSLVCVVRSGQFDAVIGGDLSGYNTTKYKNIETSVAYMVGQVEVYKVHHHGSNHSSNPEWLQTIKPLIGIISCGDGNGYGHPAVKTLNRLHAENVKTYWTESGSGAATPQMGMDVIGGNIIVEAPANSTQFTVTYGTGQTDTYTVWNPIPVITGGATGTTNTVTEPGQYFAWSKNSQVYHLNTCSYVDNISAWNLQTNNVPPANKRLHLGCPRLPE